MAGKLFLGGGGSEYDEAQLWQEAFGPGQRITLWPYARSDRAQRAEVARWFTTAVTAWGRYDLDVWLDDDLGPRGVTALANSDILAIPGGNTFDLLAHLQSRGWLTTVRRFHAGGGHVYGGSAGAVLMGADISPALNANHNETALTDLNALNLLEGAIVRPHYEPALCTAMQALAASRRTTVWAVPERAGVIVDGATARAVGPDPVHIFAPGAHRLIEPGRTWPLSPSVSVSGAAEG